MIGTGLRRALRRAGQHLRREDGNASVEFVVVFPILFYLLICSVESGYYMVREVMLDRAVDVVVRDVRLGKYTNPSHDKLKAEICKEDALMTSNVLLNCDKVMKLELRPIDTATFTPLDRDPDCIDRSDPNIQIPRNFSPGTKNQIMLLRACAVVNPIFPLDAVGLWLEKDSTGGYQLVSTSAFVYEPK